jgi:transcriptional regulator with XRE-family HTH domain
MTGEEYRELRKELGLTQLQLANKFDIYPSTVARREMKTRGPISIEAEMAIRSLVPAEEAAAPGDG